MQTKLFTRLIDTLPSQCLICRRFPTRALCEDCVSQFAQPQTRCNRCALPLPAGMPQCGVCLKTPPPLDQCLAAVSYSYPWSQLISAFKFQGHTGLAQHFVKLLRAGPWIEPALDQADMVLPMPLSAQRLAERGYNQALLLASALSPGKTRADVLLRVQHTPAQHTLNRAERLAALNSAFAVEPLLAHRLQGARVVLVDDVMTTGASLYAAARVLRCAGAAHICGLVFARTE